MFFLLSILNNGLLHTKMAYGPKQCGKRTTLQIFQIIIIETQSYILIHCYLLSYAGYIVNFRCSNHDLMIERGRHLSIPRNDRFCTLCIDKNMYIFKDEFHFFYECPSYDDLRDIYFNVSWINNRTLDKYCKIHSERIQAKKRDSFNILILPKLQMSVL